MEGRAAGMNRWITEEFESYPVRYSSGGYMPLFVRTHRLKHKGKH